MATGDTLARIRLALEGQPAVVSGMKEVERQFASTKQVIGGLVGGLTVAGFMSFIKSGIDAADAMDELSERTGLAVKDIAGLQVAYKLAGMEGGDLEKSMGRLSKAMADGNKAFDAMGVKTKNADGTLRDVRTVLGAVADKFASYEDGAAKSALAQELFGKSGAAMLGVLNRGSEGLAEFDETARKLGLTLDKPASDNAAKFNDTMDLLGLGTEGIARQIAAGLTPTLATMAGEMLESANDTGTLSTASTILRGTLKTLYTVAAAGVGVFRVLGKGVGAVAAAFFEVTRGNFSGAWEALKAGSEDIDSVVASTIASVGRVWDDVGNAGVDAMAGVIRASKTAAPVVADVGKSAKQTKDEFAALLDKINGKQGGIDPNFSKELNTLYEGFTSGRFKGGVNEYVATVERFINQQQFAKDAVAAANQAWDEYFNKQEDARLKSEGQIKTAREMLESIEFETKALKMTNQEREIAISMRDLERQGIVKGTEAYEAFAEQIRAAIVTREQTQASVDAQREQLEGWKSIDKTAHDVFVNVFEDGAGTFKRLGQTLKASLLDVLYQMTVKRWIIQIAASITGQGLGVVSQALGGGSGVMGLASNGMSAYNLFSGNTASTIGSFLGYGNAAGAGFGTVGYANAVGAIGGDSLGALIGANAGWTGTAVPTLTYGAGTYVPGATMWGGTVAAPSTMVGFGGTPIAGGAAAGSSTAPGAMGAGWAALPFALAALGWFGSEMFDKGDRYSGAAFATSGGKDPSPQVRQGQINYDPITGDLPDREALLSELLGLGAKSDDISGVNDRGLLHLLRLAQSEVRMERDGGANMNWSGWIQDGAKNMADFYRGAGYANPEAMGWWENDHAGGYQGAMDYMLADPKIVEASRKLAEGIISPLDAITKAIGGSDTFKAATGMAYNNKTGQIYGGLEIWKNGESQLNWGQRDFENQNEYLRSMFTDTLGELGKLDLPKWAKEQIKGAQEQMGKLDAGDNLGAEASALYESTASSVANTITAINNLKKTIPDLANASQDAVYNITSSMGGLESFLATYRGYVQNFYSETERFDMVQKEIENTLGDLDIKLPDRTASDARAQFRALVEAQDRETEAGQRRYAALLQVADAWAQITPVLDDTGSAVARLEEHLKQVQGSIGSSLTNVLTEGLLGNLSAADLGGQMADVVIGGMYNALASNVGNQITTMMMETTVGPLIRAAMTGSSLSAAVSKDAMQNMVANAKAAAQALGTLLSSPEWQDAMKDVDAAIREIVKSMPTASYYTAYNSIQRDTQTQAERTNAAVKDAYATIRDYLRSLETEINAGTSPESRLRESQAEYLRLLGLARGGDADAISKLANAAQTYLQAGEAYYASGSMQQAIMAQVKDELSKLSGYKPNVVATVAPPNYSSAAPSNNIAPLLAEIQSMRTQIAALNEELRRNTNVTAAGAQANVDATNAGTSAANSNNRYEALLS